MKWDAFIGGSYQSQSDFADCERTVNLYPEKLESPGATASLALYPTPGVRTLATGSDRGRAHFYRNGREFAVFGGSFCEIDQLGNITVRGAVTMDSNPATISGGDDFTGQILVTSGGNAYLFTLATNAFAAIAALAGIATMGAFLEGYFLCLDTATSKVYFSALGDGSSWTTGADFFQRSLAPDAWVSMAIVGRLIWLYGEQTSEAWYNTGGSFPWAPHPSGLIQYGCAAPWSVAVLGDSACWLGWGPGGRLSVLRAQGFSVQIISTRALESALMDFRPTTAAIGDVYADDGHTFYLLTVEAASITYCYDADTSLWHERGTWGNGDYTAWRPRYHQLAFGEHRMLDADDGTVHRVSSDYTTDVGGGVIRRLRRAPAIWAEGAIVFYKSLELDVQRGVGLLAGQGSDPQIMLRISNDSGKTWVSEQWRSAGKHGEYAKRVRWTRLGSAMRRVFEIVVTDPVEWKFLGAVLDVEKGK